VLGVMKTLKSQERDTTLITCFILLLSGPLTPIPTYLQQRLSGKYAFPGSPGRAGRAHCSLRDQLMGRLGSRLSA
jgi:hypothetical protein